VNSSLPLGCLAPVWILQLSYWITYSWLVVACLVAVTCFIVEARRRSFRWLPVYAGLLALQPGWEFLYQEFIRGNFNVRADCGYPARAQSLFLLAATIAVAVFIWRRSPLRRRSFVFGLAVALLLMSITESLYLFVLSGIIPERLQENVWFQEIHESIVSGVAGPQQIFILIVICVLLYYLRRLRFRKAA
jgi:hypothetical protein